MKTNPAARPVAGFRLARSVAYLVTILALELYLGSLLVAGIGRTTVVQTDRLPAPDLNVTHLLATAH